jgi:hypothetical protein
MFSATSPQPADHVVAAVDHAVLRIQDADQAVRVSDRCYRWA